MSLSSNDDTNDYDLKIMPVEGIFEPLDSCVNDERELGVDGEHDEHVGYLQLGEATKARGLIPH